MIELIIDEGQIGLLDTAIDFLMAAHKASILYCDGIVFTLLIVDKDSEPFME
jgi:hypothetical protein